MFCVSFALNPALLIGVFTWVFALITWAVYLGFRGECVIGSQFYGPAFQTDFEVVDPGVTLGSGWCLAVAAFPLAVVAHILDIVWCLKCRKCCAPSAPAPLPYSCPIPVVACPMPAPCPMPVATCSSPCFVAPMGCPAPSPADTPTLTLPSPMAYAAAI
eukprot:RCo016341